MGGNRPLLGFVNQGQLSAHASAGVMTGFGAWAGMHRCRAATAVFLL